MRMLAQPARSLAACSQCFHLLCVALLRLGRLLLQLQQLLRLPRRRHRLLGGLSPSLRGLGTTPRVSTRSSAGRTTVAVGAARHRQVLVYFAAARVDTLRVVSLACGFFSS